MCKTIDLSVFVHVGEHVLSRHLLIKGWIDCDVQVQCIYIYTDVVLCWNWNRISNDNLKFQSKVSQKPCRQVKA